MAEITEIKPRKSRWGVLAFLVVLLAGGYFGVLYYLYLPKCALPTEYSVGAIDSRFKISAAEFSAAAGDAGKLWDDQTDKNILQLGANAPIKINLIYDDRQAQIDKINEEAGQIVSDQEDLVSLNQKFDELYAQYQQNLKSFNEKVSYWNTQGGAPEPTYSELKTQQEQLEKTRLTLVAMNNVLNTKIDQHNLSVDSFNQTVEKNRNKIITQGEYNPTDRSINIYTFGDVKELKFVIAHEIGHALGLNHVDNSKSLMYYLIQDQDVDNPVLTTEDKQALGKKCNLDADFFHPNWQNLKSLFPNKATIE